MSEILYNDFKWDISICAICGFPLEKSFPKDFPVDWKWCCSCVSFAGRIVLEGGAEQLIFTWDPLGTKSISKKLVDMLYKIEKKITIVN